MLGSGKILFFCAGFIVQKKEDFPRSHPPLDFGAEAGGTLGEVVCVGKARISARSTWHDKMWRWRGLRFFFLQAVSMPRFGGPRAWVEEAAPTISPRSHAQG